MTIVSLSYAQITHFSDPEEWLKKISFYTSIVENLGKLHVVHSIHCINYKGLIKRNNVTYHFLTARKLQKVIPGDIHRYVKQLKPEVVIVHGIHFSWQIFLLHRQLGSTANIFVQNHAERPLRHYKKYLQKINDRFITGYFFTSAEQAKGWIDSGQIKDGSRIHEVMEASSTFYPMNKTEALRASKMDGAPVYLWVGRLDDNKDPLTLIRAFVEFIATVPKARLYLVFQNDDLLGDVKNLIDRHSDNIVLAGKVVHERLHFWFNSSDFIISTSHYEGSGIAVCEGMSCGCIPILSNIPSFRMMTKNGECGLLFKPGDAQDLLSALLKSTTLHQKSEREKVLKQFDKNLSSGAIATKMLSVIKDVLSSEGQVVI